ncbi:hypothetical protein DENSPDRAFT_661345 [Dentipellis sp. KUC8613]|nr:hypothetical protein DENSPDRAFT_661345 [Dentipellis sp. KUC8613]
MDMLVGNPALSATEYWVSAERSRFASQHGFAGAIMKTQDIPGACRVLELEMGAVGLVMSSLRTRYNSLMSVNRLPSEILALVFHFVRSHCSPWNIAHHRRLRDDFRIENLSSATAWVQVTHVCRQWRATALDDPGLWSEIILGSKWAGEFLRRSRSAPILLDYTWPSAYMQRRRNIQDIGRDIARHVSHLQELRVGGLSQDLTWIVPSLRDPAPLLEKLVLLPPSDGYFALTLPPRAFNGFAPCLRYLSLGQCDSSVLRVSLAHDIPLHLEGAHDDEYPLYRQELGELLSTLQGMPALEVLKLGRLLSPPAPGTTPESLCGPLVTLPNLHTIYLHDETRNCGLLLKHLAVPATVSHEVLCTSDRHLEFLLPWLSTKFNTSSTFIRSLSIVDADGQRVRFVAQDRSDIACDISTIDSPANEEEKPLLDLLVAYYTADSSHSGVEQFFNALPLQHLDAMDVFWDGSRGINWLLLLGGNQHLQHVALRFFPDPGLDEMLRFMNRSLEGQPHPLFPSLETLTLSEVNFEDTWDDEGTKLLDWFEHLGPLANLFITASRINEEIVEELRDVTRDVDW